jgi:hypothetical protein
MVYGTRPQDDLFVEAKDTPLTEKQLAWHLNQAWKKVFDNYCSVKQLAILWAHVSLEVGRGKYIKNNNFGNIKKLKNQKYTSYRCNEVLLVDGKRKAIWFEPYHPQTLFAAWDDATSGAAHYIEFLTKPRYAKALDALKKEDVSTYVLELKNGGYFTADLGFYSKVLIKLYNEFLSKKDNLLDFREFEQQEEDFVDQDADTPVVLPSLPPEIYNNIHKLNPRTEQPLTSKDPASIVLQNIPKIKLFFIKIINFLIKFINFKK